jgi:hypothetical protein
MPFDLSPEFETEVKPDVFSLAGLIAWLEKQNPAQTYPHYSAFDCVFCRWLTAETGKQIIYGGDNSYGFGAFQKGDLNWREVFPAARYEKLIARTGPFTYGAALSRAQELNRKG